MIKVELVKKTIKENNLDAMLFYSLQNRFWLTKFSSMLGYLFVTEKGEQHLFVDGRYITKALVHSWNIASCEEQSNLKNISDIQKFLKKSQNAEVHLFTGFESIKKFLEDKKINSIGFEKEYITVDKLEQLKMNLREIDWKGIETSKFRIIKSQEEISCLSQACKITDQVYQKLLRKVKLGMSEKELSKFIRISFEELGVEELSFDTIIVSGENGALPHGQPSDKVIKEGELITVDFGCKYRGYCSDFTRTFAVGKEINPELKEIYQIVQEAQWKGIQFVRPGVKCSEIDRIVRDYIQQKGYGEYFIHSTGHGLGIEVHEEPSISFRDNTILQAGMVITIEPGIYIPDLGGVRIEDDVLVTKNGYELLTKSVRELVFVRQKIKQKIKKLLKENGVSEQELNQEKLLGGTD